MQKKSRRGFPQPRLRNGIANRVLRAHWVEEQTNAETAYLTQLIQNKTPVTVKLLNDEEITGWIEYYDRSFIRVTRRTAPNAFIYKDQIKFIIESGRK